MQAQDMSSTLSWRILSRKFSMGPVGKRGGGGLHVVLGRVGELRPPFPPKLLVKSQLVLFGGPEYIMQN